MRAGRPLSILLFLDTHRHLTAGELARRLEVSTRTIYRDIDALGTAGVPVYAQRGSHGGCYLPDGYHLRLTGLTPARRRCWLTWGSTRRPRRPSASSCARSPGVPVGLRRRHANAS